MRGIALAMLMVLGLASSAEAGTRGGRGPTPSPTPSASKTGSSPKTRSVRGRIKKNGTHVAQHRKAKAGHTKRHHPAKSHTAPPAAKSDPKQAAH